MKAHIKALGLLILVLLPVTGFILWLGLLLIKPKLALIIGLLVLALMILVAVYTEILDGVKTRENLKKKDYE